MTFTAPGEAAGGAMTVHIVEVVQSTEVAVLPGPKSNVVLAPTVKFAPLMVTSVPPAVEP
jgi:hypothetical protein